MLVKIFTNQLKIFILLETPFFVVSYVKLVVETVLYGLEFFSDYLGLVEVLEDYIEDFLSKGLEDNARAVGLVLMKLWVIDIPHVFGFVHLDPGLLFVLYLLIRWLIDRPFSSSHS